MTNRGTATTSQARIKVLGISADAALRRRATTAVRDALARLTVRPITAQVTFLDDNGPKGGRAARCAVMLRLPYRPHVQVQKVAETPRLALDAALAVLQRDLERYQKRQRDQQRHPKKYFAAKRLLPSEA
jgi:ribosome-associated translation inhibitor RaiA